jgi:hypothetical protein
VARNSPKPKAGGSPLISTVGPIFHYFGKYIPYLQVIFSIPKLRMCHAVRDAVHVASAMILEMNDKLSHANIHRKV